MDEIPKGMLSARELREAARAAGERNYDPGVPCRQGHRDRWYVRNNQCLTCKSLWNSQERAKRNGAPTTPAAAAEPEPVIAMPGIEPPTTTEPPAEPTPEIEAQATPKIDRALERRIDRALERNGALAKFTRAELASMILKSADPFMAEPPADPQPEDHDGQWHASHGYVLHDGIWVAEVLVRLELARQDAIAQARAMREGHHDARG